jgi:hypothetical protein
MISVHDPIHAGYPGCGGSHFDWRTAFDPIDTSRPIAPAELVRAMVLSLALKFGVTWRLDRKAGRS